MPGMHAADHSAAPPRWIVCQLGAREHYAIPRALHQTRDLALLITDIWGGPALAGSWLGRRLPRMDARYEPELAAVPTVAFSRTFILLAAARRLMRSREVWKSWIIRLNDYFYQRLVARRLARARPAAPAPCVFAYSYSARDIFRAAKGRGWTTVLGQINPGPREEEIVDGIYRREAGVAGTLTSPAYWERWREECGLADAIVVNSEWSRRLLVEAGIAPAKLHVIPLAYEPPGEAADFRRQYPDHFTRERPLRVLYLGAANLRKGIHLLLRAARQLSQEGAPVEFTVVGRDEVPGGLQSQLPGNVRWVAEVGRKETAAFYREADVFALPTFSDGFALTLLEAQAWKLPAIVSPHCGQVIEDGINGWVLDTLDASPIRQILRDCLQSPAILRDRAARAIGFERFSLAAISRRMQALPPVPR